MGGLLFLARVTFLCNLFFIICLLLRHTHFSIPPALSEFVVIIGWVLSVLLNFIFASTTLVLTIVKRSFPMPTWLLVLNSFFFIFQLIYRLTFSF
jgi:hypothetical protein